MNTPNDVEPAWVPKRDASPETLYRKLYRMLEIEDLVEAGVQPDNHAKLDIEYRRLGDSLGGGLSVDEIVGLLRHIPKEDRRTQAQRYKDELDLLSVIRDGLSRKLILGQYDVAERVLDIMDMERRKSLRKLQEGV